MALCRAGPVASLVVLLVGCSPARYEIQVRDTRSVRLDLLGDDNRPNPAARGTLACPTAPGSVVATSDCREVTTSNDRFVLLSRVPHTYAAERTADGIDLVIQERAVERRAPLFDEDGTLHLHAPAFLSTGYDLSTRSGFFFAGALTREDHVDIGLSDRFARGEVSYTVRLRTPVTNVVRVTKVVERPRGVAVLGYLVAGALVTGGAFAMAEGPSDGVRYGVGLPLLFLGATSAVLATDYLLQPDRERTSLAPNALRERMFY